ncbi:MAG TPA: sulfate ABC transporter ATP-binding protein [Actinobacteria bacterium]|jgi:NitT/TauT family transport system ATP-binding protein|nr:sulfate ABC transporter ATP-binding protein [Actinomycetota bacterium]
MSDQTVTSPGPTVTVDLPPDVRPVAVELERVTKVFNDAAGVPPVLQDLSLKVTVGEFICLLGASGCGKSTLLNLIAGLEAPTSGSIEVPGGRTALMFQESALFPWLTAGKNIELALRLGGVPRSEWKPEIARLLDLVHLSGQADKRVHELSGGMRQRVALARALAQRARILLMDEPFAALDAITRDVLHEELRRIWQEADLTVIFVTHNVREAVRLGQRVLLMSSRPGMFVRQWQVNIEGPRRIESPGVSALAAEITEDLRREIRRHGR